MQLWIRSQNKRCLIKVQSLIIEKNEAGNRWILVNYFGESETYLGIYNTEERAVEILDNIEHWMTQRNELIYEMPEK